MRRTTKADKIAAYDRLAEYHSDVTMLHYLMAFKPSSSLQNCDLTCREEADHGETCAVRIQGFGLGRADGGYVLVTCWTEAPEGMIGEHVVFAGSALRTPDGGERYYTSPMGIALRAARIAVTAAMSAAQRAA